MTETTGSTTELRSIARRAGWVYLILFVSGIAAEFFVRSSLIVPGDAAATAARLTAAPGLLGWGILADLVMIVSDILLAVLLYRLLVDVNRHLAALSVAFRYAQAIVLAVNLLNLYAVIALARGPQYLDAIPPSQTAALMLFLATLHGTGYALALLFFAVSLLLVSILVIRSPRFPSFLGLMLFVAALGYAADTIARTVLQTYDQWAPVFDTAVFVPAFLAELALVLYLIVRGVRQEVGS